MRRLLHVLALAGLAAACSTDASAPEPAASAPPSATEVSMARPEPAGGPFDHARSDALLAEAEAARSAGRTRDAADLFREAGFLWPDTVAAWRGMEETSGRLGRDEAEEAARFMADRAELYPSDQLFVQREVNLALRRWLLAQKAAPTESPEKLRLAARLADFYDWRYLERGVYAADEDYLNVEQFDIPAVILSGGGALFYFGAMFF